MDEIKQTKINQLLNSQPYGTVFLSSWMKNNGYSLSLQDRYKKSKWLESIGAGAMIRSGQDISYDGAIYSLQKQSNMNIHIGGKTALNLLGKAHYLELSQKNVFIFGSRGETLPKWFKNYNWGVDINYFSTSFLSDNIGLTEIELKTFTIKISSSARAIMECLYLAPAKQDLIECYELMEGLNNLIPNIIQKLLEQCSSIKVKRLFLYLAEKAGHDWVSYIDLDKIDLGIGKRCIVKNGVYIPKYKITVPKELEAHGK